MFLLVSSAYGQSSVGLKTGYTIHSLEAFADGNAKYTQQGDYYLGIVYKKRVGSFVNLTTGLTLMPAGGKSTGIEKLPESFRLNGEKPYITQAYANANSVVNIKYLQVPATAEFVFGDDITYHIFFGPYLAIPIKAGTDTHWQGIIFSDEAGSQLLTQEGTPSVVSLTQKRNLKEDLRALNVGLTGGAALNIPVSNGNISIGYNMSFGLNSIYRTGVKSNGIETTSFEIELGYFLHLK